MAIAYDASSSLDTVSTSSTATFSHTCAAGACLVVGVGQVGTASSNISGVTYNGVAMTLVLFEPSSTPTIGTSLYYLDAPASGTHDIVISISGGARTISAVSGSYTGVSGAGNPEANNGDNRGSSDTLSDIAVTVATTNAWLVGVNSIANTATQSASDANTTVRVNNTSAGSIRSALGDSNAGLSAGSHAIGTTWTGSVQTAGVVISLKPVFAGTVALAQGSFALTGFALLFTLVRNYSLTLAQGAFTLTGQALSFLLVTKWINISRNSSSMSNQSKNSSTWANGTKNSSSMTNQTKN